MSVRVRIAALVAVALVVATLSTTLLVVGIGRLRSARLYRDALEEIARLESRPDAFAAAIDAAIDHARTRSEFRQLLRLAWRLEDRLRWPLVSDIAAGAIEKRRGESEFHLALVYASAETGAIEVARDRLSEATDGDRTSRLRVFVELSDRDRSGVVARLAAIDDEFARLTADALAADATRTTLVRFFARSAVPGAALTAAMRAAVEDDRRGAVELLDRYLHVQAVARSDELPLLLRLAAWSDNAERVDTAVARAAGRSGVHDTAALIRADRALRDGRLSEAEALLGAVTTRNASIEVVVGLNRAVLARETGRDEQELQQLLALDRAVPVDTRVAHHLAAAYVRRGQVESAERVIARAADVTGIPELASLTSEIERVWLFHRSLLAPRVAIERIESDAWRFLNRYPRADHVAAFLARLLAERRDHTGLRELVGRYPQSPATWALLGRAWLAVQDDDPARALAAVQTPSADRLDPLLLQARSALALRYLPLTQAERSVAEFQRYAERRGIEDRHMRAALMHVVQLAVLQGEREHAERVMARALQLYPDDQGVYRYAGFVAVEQ